MSGDGFDGRTARITLGRCFLFHLSRRYTRRLPVSKSTLLTRANYSPGTKINDNRRGHFVALSCHRCNSPVSALICITENWLLFLVAYKQETARRVKLYASRE